MTLKECYERIGGDFEGTKSRFQQEFLVYKFVLKFLKDPSFDNLCKNLEEKNYKEAFRSIHTLKGVCQNLGFTQLFEASYDLTEKLRHEDLDVAKEFERVKDAYELTVETIKKLL